jgi:hypothetical protein
LAGYGGCRECLLCVSTRRPGCLMTSSLE